MSATLAVLGMSVHHGAAARDDGPESVVGRRGLCSAKKFRGRLHQIWARCGERVLVRRKMGIATFARESRGSVRWAESASGKDDVVGMGLLRKPDIDSDSRAHLGVGHPVRACVGLLLGSFPSSAPGPLPVRLRPRRDHGSVSGVWGAEHCGVVRARSAVFAPEGRGGVATGGAKPGGRSGTRG